MDRPARHRPRHDDTTRQLRADVDALLADLDRAVRDRAGLIARAAPAHRGDAENLVRYVALRQRDERRLQRSLADRGLSSLGRCEPHVLANVTAVRDALAGRPPKHGRGVIAGFAAGRAALDANTDALFGPRPEHRVTRVMVTLPSEAATDYDAVRGLVERGMDVARINAAHDAPAAWRAMAAHVRKAGRETGRRVLVSLDLPGPKLRTGSFAPGPRVLRLRPGRTRAASSSAPPGCAWPTRGGRSRARRRARCCRCPPAGRPAALPASRCGWWTPGVRAGG